MVIKILNNENFNPRNPISKVCIGILAVVNALK